MPLAHDHLSNAVIIYGSPRSGTTMFRLMLSGHPDLVEVGEKQYINWFSKYDSDGNLKFNHRDLFVNREFVHDGIEPRPDIDGLDLIENIIDQAKAGRQGRVVITLHFDLPKILKVFPGCKILHIVRDPRDVTASIMRLGWAGNAFYAVDNWLQAEAALEEARPQLEEGQLLSLKYKDLAESPELELKRISDFLGIEYSDAFFNYAKRTTYDLPSQSRIQGWRKNLTEKDIKLIELRCRSLMMDRGFTPETEAGDKLSKAYLFYLKWDHRWRKMLRDISAYGAVNTLGAKLGSKLRLLGVRDYFNRRINAIINEKLE
jgi:hypothetical protein